MTETAQPRRKRSPVGNILLAILALFLIAVYLLFFGGLSMLQDPFDRWLAVVPIHGQVIKPDTAAENARFQADIQRRYRPGSDVTVAEAELAKSGFRCLRMQTLDEGSYLTCSKGRSPSVCLENRWSVTAHHDERGRITRLHAFHDLIGC